MTTTPTSTERRHAGGDATRGSAEEARRRLLADLPVAERHLDLAGIRTALLEGGEGPPVILLHGPGEFAPKWRRVLPRLAEGHRVVAPDLPAHGASGSGEGPLDADRVFAWLGELIDATCASRPALVGHVLGGAIAARFAARHGDRIERLVLVDSLGLGPFRPAPRFAATMIAFMARPGERTYDRFMRQCSWDLDGLRTEMGESWEPFVSYTLHSARSPRAGDVRALMREVGVRRIPAEDLARIPVPTSLIWGRHDRANRLRVAEEASARHGWPLEVIEGCADDPGRDRPEAFVQALGRAFARP